MLNSISNAIEEFMILSYLLTGKHFPLTCENHDFIIKTTKQNNHIVAVFL